MSLGKVQSSRNFWRSPRFAQGISVALFLVGWELILPLIPTDLIPSPLRVGEFMWAELRGDTLAPQTVYQAFGSSLRRLLAGFGISLLVGVPIGLLMGLFKRVEYLLHDFVVLALAAPALIWALLVAMWWGFGDKGSIITVVLASVPFVIMNIAEGVRATPKDLLDMGMAYDKSNTQRVRYIVLPSLMPFLFASLRYGLAHGWKALVLAEIFASTNGAGWTIRFWFDAGRVHSVIGYAVFFMILALLVERLIFDNLERRAFRWRPSMERTDVRGT